MRHYIKFYIDRNNKLRAIWFNERVGKRTGKYNDVWTQLDEQDPKYAVRSVRLCRSCDKHSISKVGYWNNANDCVTAIDNRVNRHTKPSFETLSNYNYYQLARCPMKYIQAFFNYIRTYLTDEEVDKIRASLIISARP